MLVHVVQPVFLQAPEIHTFSTQNCKPKSELIVSQEPKSESRQVSRETLINKISRKSTLINWVISQETQIKTLTIWVFSRNPDQEISRNQEVWVWLKTLTGEFHKIDNLGIFKKP